jgi:hypothetical protein
MSETTTTKESTTTTDSTKTTKNWLKVLEFLLQAALGALAALGLTGCSLWG